MMEVSGSSESYARSKFVFAKYAILILPKCAIFSEVGKIQHGAIKYGNKSTL